MDTSLIITDVTRMSGQRVCVAGVDSEGKTIRPVFEYKGIPEDWLYRNSACIIRPFAQVKMYLLKNRPQPPHTEDWLIPDIKPFSSICLDRAQRRDLLEKICDQDVASIFGAEIHHDLGHYILSGQGRRSLGTISIRSLRAVMYERYSDRWNYRIEFEDALGSSYRLNVTDLSFRYYLDYLRMRERQDCAEIGNQLTQQFRGSAVYLRVGLARGWNKFPDRCYLQITGVYTFPDYLQGRCFADFRSQAIAEEAAEY